MSIFSRILVELKNTGERPHINTVFEDINPILQFAYRLASKKALNKSVLDYGCGGGYGTEFLSRFTSKRVDGYDIDQNTISNNNKFYSSRNNIAFIKDINQLKSYDLIVSFQVIEHIKYQDIDNYLKDIKNKFLIPKGIFFLSTVNKNITSYKLKKTIFPFHEYEFEPFELRRLLKKYFRVVKIYGQTSLENKILVSSNRISYKNKNFSIKIKIIRMLAQFELVRKIARHTPLIFKKIITFTKEENRNIKHILVKTKKLIENSYILIYECHN